MSSDGNFLSRWSRLKRASKDAPAEPAPEQNASLPAASSKVPAESPAQPVEPVPLPPIESLTPESDFTPFMQPKVDAETKRNALKKLFADPRFNAMDGLDVYIDDYTKSQPIPAGWLEKMEQMRHLGVFKPEEPAENQAASAAAAEAPAKPLPEQAVGELPAAGVPNEPINSPATKPEVPEA